jgi:hypothetical protein
MQGKIEPREYQLRTGEWVPQAQVWVVVVGGIDVHTVMSRRGVNFDTREQARAHSERLGQLWVNEALF